MVEHSICKHCHKKIKKEKNIFGSIDWYHMNGFMYCGSHMRCELSAEPISIRKIRVLKLKRICG